MRRTRFDHLLLLAAAALATSAQAHIKGPTTARPDSGVRPDKMQPAPSKPLTPQGPLAAPATGTAKPLTPQGPLAAPAMKPLTPQGPLAAKPLTPQGPLAAPATGTVKPLTPSPANAPAAPAPRPGAARSSIDTHVK